MPAARFSGGSPDRAPIDAANKARFRRPVLVLSRQSPRSASPPENLAAGIDQIPVAPDLMRLGGESGHGFGFPRPVYDEKRVILLKK